MDTLTHALSGALLARATDPSTPRADQLPRRLRMWVGFWAAAFPDSDIVVNLVDSFTYLMNHRGVTHSVILLPLWALGLAFLFALIAHRRYSWKAFFFTCALGIGAHIAGDLITSFGTMIFAPLSDWRAALSTTFILDPYFSGIIVAGLIASTVWKNSRLPALAGLVLLGAYVGAQSLLQQRAVAVGKAYIAANHLESAEAAAMPQPFSPFNWMVVVQQPGMYRVSYISLWRNQAPPPPPDDASWFRRINAAYRPVDDATWETVSRYGRAQEESRLAASAWLSPPLARYRHFAVFPAMYRVDRDTARNCVWFNDLRFTTKGRTPPFRYGACRAMQDGEWKLYRLRHDDAGRDLLDAVPD